MKGLIYEYYNPISDKYYIGQTINSFKKRDWAHRHSKSTRSYFDNAYNKNPENFSSRILLTLNVNSKELLKKILNVMEETYIFMYKCKGKQLYNILNGGNQGWTGIVPTKKMLEALQKGRERGIKIQKMNKLSDEERRLRHNIKSKEYRLNHPDKVKEIYTKANIRRREIKRKWYLDHKELCIQRAKIHYQKSKIKDSSLI